MFSLSITNLEVFGWSFFLSCSSFFVVSSVKNFTFFCFLFGITFLFWVFCWKVGDWSQRSSWNSLCQWNLPASGGLSWALPDGSSTGPNKIIEFWDHFYSIIIIAAIFIDYFVFVLGLLVLLQVIFLHPAPLHPHIYSNGHICLGWYMDNSFLMVFLVGYSILRLSKCGYIVCFTLPIPIYLRDCSSAGISSLYSIAFFTLLIVFRFIFLLSPYT